MKRKQYSKPRIEDTLTRENLDLLRQQSISQYWLSDAWNWAFSELEDFLYFCKRNRIFG
jgi:hypothetical protein